jgi:hypothetical protein
MGSPTASKGEAILESADSGASVVTGRNLLIVEGLNITGMGDNVHMGIFCLGTLLKILFLVFFAFTILTFPTD